MQKVNIPPAPIWNLPTSCVCTPDDGLLYAGHKVINYISKNQDNGEESVVKAFHTRQRVKSIECDPDWSETKYFAAVAEDNSIHVWDFNNSDRALYGHVVHVKIAKGDGQSPSVENVNMCFMQNRNVLSVDGNCLVRYCVASNTYCKLKRIIPKKHTVSLLKGSPYDKDIFAAGSSRGCVLVVSLKTEAILYSLSGHNASVTSLAWMKIPDSYLKASETETVALNNQTTQERVKLKAKKSVPIVSNDDIFDIYDYDYLEHEFGAPSKQTASVATATEKECYVGLEKPKQEDPNLNFNFIEACEHLKEEIGALRNDQPSDSQTVTLQDCENGPRSSLLSSPSCPSDHSVQILDCSSDECESDDRKIVHHQAEVHQTDEVPFINESEHEPQYETVVLASGDKEGYIWIWDTKIGCSIKKLAVCATSHNFDAPIHIVWLSVNSLLSNSRSGALVLWNVEPATKDKKITFTQDARTFAKHSNVMAFCKSVHDDTIWSISSCREIVCENITEDKVLAKFNCVSTNISAMRERSDDMNKLALAFADRRVGVLNLSNLTPTNVSMDTFSKNMDAQILALTWSPGDKYLAYATSTGRVGILDTEKPNNSVTLNPFCGKSIYSLDWKGEYIYACCIDRVAVYHGNMKDKDPIIVDGITDVSEISVKDNFLFVGMQNGRLAVYKKISATFQYEKIEENIVSDRYISEINWNPIQTNRFIASSLSHSIKVFSWTEETGLQPERTLSSHGVASVKWSNRNPNMFLACSFNGSVQVWNLEQSDTAVFSKQFHCPMLCGIFSPLDENIIICAGKSTSLEMFDMRVDKNQIGVKGITQKNEGRQFGILHMARCVTTVATASQSKKKKNNRKSQLPIENGQEIASQLENLTLNKEPEESVPENKNFLKSHSTIFHLTTREGNKETLKNLISVLGENPSNEATSSQILSKKLFGSRADVEALLNAEFQNHQVSQTKSIANVLIPQMNGKLKEEILNCIQHKKLNEWHISLAPTISYDFWKKCCQAYSKQLLEQGLILQAATYMLSLHEIREVVQILIDQFYFKEAWIMAKLYMQPEDPMVSTILDSWIAYLDVNGHHEGAAFVCALSGQLDKCRDVLNKRRMPTEEHAEVLALLEKKLAEAK